jgi:hypothetical protein
MLLIIRSTQADTKLVYEAPSSYLTGKVLTLLDLNM